MDFKKGYEKGLSRSGQHGCLVTVVVRPGEVCEVRSAALVAELLDAFGNETRCVVVCQNTRFVDSFVNL